MTLKKIVRIPVLTAALLGLLPMSAAAKDPLGQVVYLEQGVQISRGGQDLDDVDFGTPVENCDLLTTDRTGFAEVRLTAARAADGSIKVFPGTCFYFEVGSVGKTDKTSVHLLSGSLNVKVQKLGRSKAVDIRSETATMGVRGTEFQVTATPGGDLLVTAREGRVSCVDEEGAEVFAVPGQAVEKVSSQPIRSIPVAVSSLETFQREWYTQRLEVFKANALRAIQAYSTRYQDLSGRFDRSYRDLMSHQPVIRKWMQEDRQDTVGSRMEILREKKELIGDLLALRKILFLFERIYFRLQELEAYHEQGYGRGQVRPGLSTAGFFLQFDQEAKGFRDKMAQVRYITKLYAQRNDGAFPTDSFEGEGSGELNMDSGDLFGKDGSF